MIIKKFSILYVDDEESNLRIFKNTFRKIYNIYTANSAKEGIRILEEEPIDIILSDQRMPEMTGVEFLKYALNKHPELNRILITGYTDFSAIKNAINDAKIYQYVQKPWREDDLHNTIEEALKIYALEIKNNELISELKLTNDKLQFEKENVEQSNRLKSVFLENISHEIRTPMNGIIGFSKLLQDENLNHETRIEYTDIVIRSSDRLLKIIDDIVEISKVETNQNPFKSSKFDINLFFEDIDSICTYKAAEKDIKFTLINNISPKYRTILTDESKLHKIIENLVDNSLRYTNEGFIEVGCSAENNFLKVYVKDSGIGISPEMHEQIFERFRQGDESNSRAFDGLGLGLAIVKENIKILNGNIKLESEKGKGSTFTFSIPFSTDSEIQESMNEYENPNSYKTISGESFNILVAEDDFTNLFFLKTLLKTILPKANIFEAKTGFEAIEMMKNNPTINLILMDIKMPELDGLDATKEIRKFNENIKIIAQTAYSSENDYLSAIEAGCNDFISKPIKMEDLTKLIVKHML